MAVASLALAALAQAPTLDTTLEVALELELQQVLLVLLEWVLATTTTDMAITLAPAPAPALDSESPICLLRSELEGPLVWDRPLVQAFISVHPELHSLQKF